MNMSNLCISFTDKPCGPFKHSGQPKGSRMASLPCFMGRLGPESSSGLAEAQACCQVGKHQLAVMLCRWTRQWTAEENRHGDLMNKYCMLSGRVNMRVRTNPAALPS